MMDKYKEAIRHFEYTVRALKYLDECPDTPYTKHYIKIRNAKNRRRLQASRLAIEALEKQMSKPLNHRGAVVSCGCCPTCERLYWDENSVMPYCDMCGQKLREGK